MSRRAYHILDVFTDTPFAGNPLAVVMDCAGLDAARMQKIAREFNLSETVFVRDAGDPVNTARLRIFTPASELPFAGHPTIGAAALIAHLRAPEHILKDELRVVLRQALEGVQFLHARGVFHLDLKPDNILMKDGVAKITDFGAAHIGQEETSKQAGTRLYAAPEAVEARAARDRDAQLQL